MRSPRSIARVVTLALVALTTLIGVEGIAPQASAALNPHLTRYPYLTDVTQGYATVNWATDRSGTKGSVTYGRVGTESCSAHKVNGSKTSITINGVSEYQWKAKLSGLAGNAQYCYRVLLGTTDLLTSSPSPQFYSQIPAGATTPYSFAVLGDWGETDQNGNNPAQAAVMSSIANSGVRFAVGAGDTAYDSGTQKNYGDLQQTGYRVSSVFGPDYWTQAGASVPLFNAVGNHGANATFFNIWPQDRTVAASSGKYQMETYCCANGANSQKSASGWYAFDAGVARIYMLTTTWGNSNVGTSDPYGMDYAYRWQQSSPEYKWLKNDLQSHPSQLKFAIFHYPLYSDNATEVSDTYLQGANSLEGLLSQNGVNLVFNGHAHIYQHNAAAPGGVVSYISGGGGGTPEPITKCKPIDQYGIGWSTNTGGQKCGNAPKPTQIEQVYHWIKVDVNGFLVTVTGVNALGQQFDQTTYDFAPDAIKPTAPGNLQATAPTGNRVDLTWDASSDNRGVIAYDVYRQGANNPIATVDGSSTSYSDDTVSANTQYTYWVTARDAANNTSDPSNQASATTPSLDSQNPSDPTNLQASATTSTKVHLSWDASNDNVGVTAYDVYRGGEMIDSVDGQTTSYDDTTVAPGVQYSYTVRARDLAGNTSNDSNTAIVTTPSAGVLFVDDFESGNLSSWTTNSGLSVVTGYPAPSGGLDVARQSSTGAGGTYAYKSFSNQTTVYAQFQFKVNSRSGAVDLMRFRNGSGGSKLSLFIHGSSGQLSTRNSSGTTTRSSTVIDDGVWYQVQIEGQIGTDTTQVWLNGVHITDLDATGSLGSTNFGQFLLGTTGTGTYDTVFDDVVVSKNPI